jgi:hypothetical protein
MAVNLSPVGGVAGQFFDNNGNPLTGGKLYTYAAGTTTPQATYTSAAGTTAHTNPIILDAAGRVPSGEIWLTDGLQYKFVLKNSSDVTIGTYDNIVGINSNFVNFVTETEIQTATAGQTVFTLTTMQYQPGTNNLSVFVDGVNQYDGVSYSYVETSSTVVTFTAGLHVGALVKFTTAQTLSTGVTDSSLVTYDPPFTGSVATTVEDKLAQYVSVKDFGAAGDGVTDDTAAIQDALDAMSGTGTYVSVPAGTYKVSSALLVPTLTGLIGDGSATLYVVNSGFNNANPSAAGRYVNNGVVINLSGQTVSPYTAKYGQKISGLKIQYQYAVGYSVNAIVARNCFDLEISNNEIFDFPLCRAIMVASLQGNSRIVGNYIHDLENNYVFPGYGFAERGQFNETGIDVDEDTVNAVLSNRLVIENNYIENIHYGATAIAVYEDQADGITLRNATGIRVTNNTVIDTNEGFDFQGFNTLAVGNVISDCTGYGIKLIHGARYNMFNANHIKNSGLAAIIVVGGLLAEGDTSFNVFSSNTIENVDPSNLHSGDSTACIRIQNQSTTSVASNNSFVDNHIDPGVYGEFIVYNYTTGDVNNRYAGNLVQRSAVVEDFYVGPTLNAQIVQQINTNVYAYAATPDSIPPTTWTRIAYNTELFDTNSEFNTTNQNWVCKTPGYYRFIVHVGLTTANGVLCSLKKNSSFYAYSDNVDTAANNTQSSELSVVAYADIGDIFDGFVYHSSGTGAALITGSPNTYFCVSKT